ncbi:MAG: hypothetical protein LUD17_12015 [Bacteroidales bacterium]|nr:hypothetical protein [Bacteroidales bacterium]
MKKMFYLLIAALPIMAIAFASCSNDDDLPNVDISLDVSEGTVVDDTIYVVQGDSLVISGITVTNNEEGKAATVTNVNYYWDGYFMGPSIFSPFGFAISTENVSVGIHTIGVTCTVLAVDKSIATAALSFPVRVVESTTDLPEADASAVHGLARLKL